jgi:hypothetical protein
MLQQRKKGSEDKFITQLQSFIFPVIVEREEKIKFYNKVVSPLLQVLCTHNSGGSCNRNCRNSKLIHTISK